MGTIKLLPSALSDQIAAGEVVERPSSVAKELLENALDAEATRILVDFMDGGVSRLRIVDNGSGMRPDDAVLSIRRHATSKISTVDDLNQIGTLGFRGEALASIASVSRFSLRTKTADALAATKIEVEGGEVSPAAECGGPIGTEIIVSDLFYNVPARRKFLKKPQTEASHIIETAQRLAICYPHVAFKVVRDAKTVFDIPIHQDLEARLRAIFPASQVQKLRSIHVPGAFGLRGMIGSPEEGRGSTRHYYLFINGRIVKDRVLMSAIQSGCGHRLSKGKHPFVVLSLSLPSQAVDVNVHPAKTEVRFADSRQIFRLVARAVEAALNRSASSLNLNEPANPISSLEIKKVVNATALQTELRTQGRASGNERVKEGGDALAAQKRRVFDAMARLAKSSKGFAAPKSVEKAPRRSNAVDTAEKNLERKDSVNGDAPTALPLTTKPSEETPGQWSKKQGDSKLDSAAQQAFKNKQRMSSSAPIQSSLSDEALMSVNGQIDVADLLERIPQYQHQGWLFFAGRDGVLTLNLASMQEEIFRRRLKTGDFLWSHWKEPVIKSLGTAGRAERIIRNLSSMGIQSESFGVSTLRLVGHDQSLESKRCSDLVIDWQPDRLANQRDLEKALLGVARASRMDDWRAVLTDPLAGEVLASSLTPLSTKT